MLTLTSGPLLTAGKILPRSSHCLLLKFSPGWFITLIPCLIQNSPLLHGREGGCSRSPTFLAPPEGLCGPRRPAPSGLRGLRKDGRGAETPLPSWADGLALASGCFWWPLPPGAGAQGALVSFGSPGPIDHRGRPHNERQELYWVEEGPLPPNPCLPEAINVTLLGNRVFADRTKLR